MTAFPDLAAVRRRLGGVVLRTPLVGVTSLGGPPVPAGLRIKLECLQVGGSAWFRGAFHQLAVALGAHKAVVAHGPVREVLAAATAAALQRIPAFGILRAVDAAAFGGEVALHASLGPLPGVEFEILADDAAIDARLDVARGRGHAVLPPRDGPAAALADAAFAAGLATIGLELAEDMASDVEQVVVAPGWLVEPVRSGIAAGGRHDCEVIAGVADGADAGWREAVRIGLRCDSDVAGAVLPAAVAAAARGGTVAVLGA